MGVVGTAELAAAVSNAGGLGMVSGAVSDVAAVVAALRRLTDGSFGVNFLMPFLGPDALDAIGDVPVIEFFYGDPDPELVARARRGGAKVGWQAGTLEEALGAQKAGCDYVVLQGKEAGGHVRGEAPLEQLLQRGTMADVPIVAAGGIGSATQVADALAAGASAVRCGTRFLAADESAAHPAYIEALIGSTRDDTVLTTAFGVGWPDAPHRVLRSAVDAAERADTEVISTIGGAPIPRFSPVPPTRDTEGDVRAMALYAGHSVDSVARVQPAAEIVQELLAGI
jgi:NAD(P)H-dependent flavin oxidoreductase YrpB (nitropropane dioxygenase family)